MTFMQDDLSYIPEAFRSEIEDIPQRCRRWCYDGDGGGGGGGGSSGADASGASAGVGGEGTTGGANYSFFGESTGIGNSSTFDPSGLQAQIDALTAQQSQFDTTRALEAERFGAAQGLEAERFGLARGALDPFATAGQTAAGQIPTTAQGLDQQLADIFSGSSFQNLLGERTRAAQAGLSAGGLTRSGAGISGLADISSDLGLELANQIFGRQKDVANRGLQASLGQAQLGAPGLQESLGGLSQLAGLDISALDATTREKVAEIGAAAQVESARLGGQATKDAASSSSISSAVGTALGIGARLLMWSDPALKENVREVGRIGPLTLCEWDWIPAAKDTIVNDSPTIGFMADEVERHYPQFVGEYCGFKTIDYRGLTEVLEAA